MKTKTNGRIQITIGILVIIFSIIWCVFALYSVYINTLTDAASAVANTHGQESARFGNNLSAVPVVGSLATMSLVTADTLYLFIAVMALFVLLGIKFVLDGLAMLNE